jgi:hypothetical protein
MTNEPTSEAARAIAQTKSYTGQSVVAGLLFLLPITWPIGFYLAWRYRSEAKRMQALAGGSSLPGQGCLGAVFWFGILTLVVWVVLIMSLLAGDGDSSTSTTPTGNTQGVMSGPGASDDASNSEDAVGGIGESVTSGDSVWIVDDVINHGNVLSSDNEFISDVMSSGMLIQVDARIKSTGSDSFALTSPTVVDDQGRAFDASSDVLMLIDTDRACIFETINPGIEKACTWVFDVPADATGLTLQASGGLFTKAVPIRLDR